MTFVELMLLSVALAMDAFAASLCKGLSMGKPNYKHITVIALFFGGFQALMPLVGYFLGVQFERYITAVDHWIAFGLLFILGLKMIIDAVRERNDCGDCSSELDFKELVVMSIATSIDALAVGISLAFLGANILLSVGMIGIITFVLCFIGCILGCRFGVKYRLAACIVGGSVLILTGVKILLEHLGVLSFDIF